MSISTAVDLRTEVTVDVPVHIVGESALVKMAMHCSTQQVPTTQVRALPADIPSFVEVDISGLDSFDKSHSCERYSLRARGRLLPQLTSWW